jgi:hypothetical protein
MNTKLQFRVLYRQFLFRLMDVELLSASAGGDASAMFGQFVSLLIFGSLLSAYMSLPIGAAVRDSGLPGPVWWAERTVISVTMLVVGVFALLSWDSTFPDRRDVLVLAPLPVRVRTLFAAKIAAAASALGLTLAMWNSLSGFAWPMVLAPAGSGYAGTMRFVAAFWVTLLVAGIFLYCAVLGVQAFAAQLPRSWYLRVSPLLQMTAFVLFLGVLFFQPSLDTAAALVAPENQRTLAWLPPYWFLGLLSELSGVFPAEWHAVMAPLARRALLSLAIAIVVAGGSFALSYLRTLRKIVEEPDIAPGARGGMWLPRFGNSRQTALAQFVIRTLLRSRRHRSILAFYLGGGFAIAAVSLEGARQAMHLTFTDLIEQINVPVLGASVVMLCASWLGTRTVFSMPLDLRTNWLLQVTPTPGGADLLSAVRRALLALAVLPVLAAWAVLLLFWPWVRVVEHLLLLGLLGSLLVDISLNGFRKIPFTCSYLPGKSKAHLVFWFGIIPLVVAIDTAVELEQRAMASPLSYLCVAVTLVAAAFAARRVTDRSANRNGPEIQFEESPSDGLVVLGLNG